MDNNKGFGSWEALFPEVAEAEKQRLGDKYRPISIWDEPCGCGCCGGSHNHETTENECEDKK